MFKGTIAKISKIYHEYPPMLMMALRTFLYVIGFSMHVYVSVYGLLVLAMVIITVGEMVVSPVSQALVASFAHYMGSLVFRGEFRLPLGPISPG